MAINKLLKYFGLALIAVMVTAYFLPIVAAVLLIEKSSKAMDQIAGSIDRQFHRKFHPIAVERVRDRMLASRGARHQTRMMRMVTSANSGRPSRI